MLKLLADQTQQADATLPVRWCVSLDVLERLKSGEVQQPHLLLVVTHENEEVDRYLLPLGQMMHYLQFHRPGKHKLFAAIVWDSAGNLVQLYRDYLSRRRSGYCERVYEPAHTVPLYDGEGEPTGKAKEVPDRLRLDGHSTEETSLEVVVADAFFAKKAAAWEWRWVNLWFETKPRDQCQFRRRRFLAYSIQPIVVLLFLIVKPVFELVAATFLTAIGMRRTHFGPILHPWKNDADEVWEDVKEGGNVFLTTKDGKNRPAAIVVFFPPILMVGWVITGMIIDGALKIGLGALSLILITLGIAAVISGLIATVTMLKNLIYSQRYEQQRAREHEMWEREKRERAARELILKRQLDAEYARLGVLSCDRPGLSASLRQLPKERQTVYLRFLDLKAKVCRPFAN